MARTNTKPETMDPTEAYIIIEGLKEKDDQERQQQQPDGTEAGTEEAPGEPKVEPATAPLATPAAEPDDKPIVLIGTLGDFTFKVADNVPIPVTAKTPAKSAAHEFVSHYDNMGHNSTLFIPVAYWVEKRGKPINAIPFAFQRQSIMRTFVEWRKKSDLRTKWKLVLMNRNVGEDPVYPANAGVRLWFVDESRQAATK